MSVGGIRLLVRPEVLGDAETYVSLVAVDHMYTMSGVLGHGVWRDCF